MKIRQRPSWTDRQKAQQACTYICNLDKKIIIDFFKNKCYNNYRK